MARHGSLSSIRRNTLRYCALRGLQLVETAVHRLAAK